VIIALLSDIHSNYEALTACLQHARENGASRHAFLGDLVGYGADPTAVVELVTRYAGDGAIVIKGNHDEAVEKDATYMNDSARDAIDWTRKVLDADAQAFLAGLPLIVREGKLCFVHGSAVDPARWDYVDSPSAAARSVAATGTAYTFSGHVHDQVLYFGSRGGRMTEFHPRPASPVPASSRRNWLAIVGSVGQPRDKNPAAAYTLFDCERETFVFHRVPYDHYAAARKVRAAGLSESLAWRLEHGV
jgi:diadenosine tetraphosphatase ApaH/serine/threonine PP2A family protein phosphatase